ncbi:MAG: hypothetical protein RL150_392 [Candidatus Parcubacteria bacterium]|jgi:hypothetical protein
MKKLLYTSVLALLLCVGFSHTAHALTISPAKIEVTGDPGSVLSGEIEIFNEQSEPKTFYTSSENFEPRGDSGAPYFVGAPDGLATWIETQPEVTVAPGERLIVPYKITVPSDARAGGYFAAIFFGNQPPTSQSGGEVTIGGKIGALVLLRVSGDIEEKGGLTAFGSKEGQRFFTKTPIAFSYTLNNLGGDRIVPNGEIKIKNSFWLTTATLIANKHEGSVLPNSSRAFEVVWTDASEEQKKKGDAPEEAPSGFFANAGAQLRDFHIGVYTAKIDIVWGESEQRAKDSFVFFVIPWQLLSIVLVVLIILGLISLRFIRRYNKWIIAQAQMQMRAQQPAPRRPAQRTRIPVAPEGAVAKAPVKRRVTRKADE